MIGALGAIFGAPQVAHGQPVKVVIVPQAGATVVASILRNQTQFDVEITDLSNSLGLVDLATLRRHDVAIVWTNQGLDDAQSTRAGDALAAFVDEGGAVIEMVFSHYLPNNDIAGRWRTQGYGLVSGTADRASVFSAGLMGTVEEPRHPIMQQVRSVRTDSFRTGAVSLLPGAQRIASYSDGQVLVAARQDKAGRVVWLGIYPSAPQALSGDWEQLIINATQWAGQPVNASAGGTYTIEEGTPTVTLDASNSAGTLTAYDWDVDLDGEYDDAQGVRAIIDTSGLDGPGNMIVGLRVIDDEGREGTATATIVATNVAPEITSVPPRQAPLGGVFTYPIRVTDPAGSLDTLAFSLLSGPEGADFDDFGTLTWTPPPESLEQTFNFTVRVDDGDGGSDEQSWEVVVRNSDTDMDTILDHEDNCPGLSNTDQADLDDDAIGDKCDTDVDGDGLTRRQEVELFTDDTTPDTDGDGLLDGQEVEMGTNPALADGDEDGLSDPAELELGTDPNVADTDGDGLLDGDELIRGTNPINGDTDDDGLLDGQEVELGTDPLVRDTDGDGISDGDEVSNGSNPLDPLNKNPIGGSPIDKGCQCASPARPAPSRPQIPLLLPLLALAVLLRRR